MLLGGFLGEKRVWKTKRQSTFSPRRMLRLLAPVPVFQRYTVKTHSNPRFANTWGTRIAAEYRDDVCNTLAKPGRAGYFRFMNHES